MSIQKEFGKFVSQYRNKEALKAPENLPETFEYESKIYTVKLLIDSNEWVALCYNKDYDKDDEYIARIGRVFNRDTLISGHNNLS